MLSKSQILFLIGLTLVTANTIYTLVTGPDLTEIKLGVTFLVLEILAFVVIINIIFNDKLFNSIGYIKKGIENRKFTGIRRKVKEV